MSPFPQLGCISIKIYSCVEYAAFLCVDPWNILDSSCAVQELLWLQFACKPHTSSKSHLTRCSSSWLLYPKPEYSNCVICTSSLNPPKLALLGSWVVANMFHTHQVISLCLTNAFNLLLKENSEFISSVCWHTGDNRFVCVMLKWGELLIFCTCAVISDIFIQSVSYCSCALFNLLGTIYIEINEDAWVSAWHNRMRDSDGFYQTYA